MDIKKIKASNIAALIIFGIMLIVVVCFIVKSIGDII